MQNDRETLKNIDYSNITAEEIDSFENKNVPESIIKKIKEGFSSKIFKEDSKLIDLQEKSLGEIVKENIDLKAEFEQVKNDYLKILTKDDVIIQNFKAFNPFGVGGLVQNDACQHYQVVLTNKGIILVGINFTNLPITIEQHSFGDIQLIHLDHYSRYSYNLTIYTKKGSYYFLTCETNEFKELIKYTKNAGIQIKINDHYKQRVFLYWLLVLEFYLYIPIKMSSNESFGIANFIALTITVILLFLSHKKARSKK